MADQVDNTKNPLIPPPKKDELSAADPHKFKQVMKELSTDTEQKGKWKPQKEEDFQEEGVGEADEAEETPPPYISGGPELGATTQGASAAASAQSPPAEAPIVGEPGYITPEPSPVSATPQERHKRKEQLEAGEPVPLNPLTEKKGAAALGKTSHKGGPFAEKGGTKSAEAAAMGSVPASPPQEAALLAEKEKVKRKPGSAGPAEMGTQPPPQPPLMAPPLTTLEPAAYTQMTPQLQEFFQKLVGVLTVMKATGVSETVIKLNAPAGSRLSIFNGSEISIKEYSSAPKSFNIQFNGNPEAVNLVQGNLGTLMAALSDKEYNFKVNRFDIGLAPRKDEPLFKRKGPISGGGAG